MQPKFVRFFYFWPLKWVVYNFYYSQVGQWAIIQAMTFSIRKQAMSVPRRTAGWCISKPSASVSSTPCWAPWGTGRSWKPPPNWHLTSTATVFECILSAGTDLTLCKYLVLITPGHFKEEVPSTLPGPLLELRVVMMSKVIILLLGVECKVS